MGDGENNIPLGLSLITKEANANTYTNLHLFAEFRKIAEILALDFLNTPISK